MSFVKDNGGPIALVLMFFGAVAGYIELRLPSDADIQAKVDAKFVAAGAVAPHRMDQAEKDIDENTDDIDDVQTRWNNLVDTLATQRVPDTQ